MSTDEKSPTLRATLRVVIDRAGSESRSQIPRPSSQQIDQAAGTLGDLGFRVVGRGRFAVEVEGTPDVFRNALHIHVEDTERGLACPIPSPDARLKDLIDFVEILPRPQYYGDRLGKVSYPS